MQRLIGKKTSENGEPGGSAGHDPSRLRLDALDGIRGLAALYVALYHALGYAGYTTTQYTDLSAPMQLIAAILDLGVYAVPVFIVLSGFCLMLPLAQRDTTYLPGGVSSYVLRRAWGLKIRLAPPPARSPAAGRPGRCRSRRPRALSSDRLTV